MLDTENVMGTGTHILPETHKHKDLTDFSLFDFGVQEVPLHYHYYDKTKDREVLLTAEKRKAVIRSDTGDFIGNHSTKYKTIPHIDLYKPYTDKLLDSKLKLGNVEVIDQTWDGGAKARRTIHFLDHKAEVGTGDKVALRTDIFNSLDGAWAFQTFTGAFRSLCLNTLVFGGQKFYHEHRKHTSGLNINSALSKITGTLDMFTNQADEFNKWNTTKITDEDVVKLLANTICYKPSKTVETIKDLDDNQAVSHGVIDSKNVNTRLSDYLLYRFDKEKQSLGSTLWSLYNAVTHWSTHTDESYEKINDKGKVIEISMGRKGSQKANVQKDREIAVRNMLDSQQWQELAVA